MAFLFAASVALTWLSGCHRHDHAHDEHDHGEEHAAEERTAQITAWTDRHEVFIDHSPAIAGTPARFVTHVTDGRAAEPRRKGGIKFSLRFGTEAAIEHREEQPARPGIYEAMLTFPKAGLWQVTVTILNEEGDDVLELTPIHVFPNEEEARKAPAPEAPEGINFTKEQQWRLSTRVQPITSKSLAETISLPATVTARPGFTAAVTAPVAGVLLSPTGKAFPALGEKVEKGQTLAWIQPAFSELGVKLVQAETDVIRSKLELDQSKLAYERIQKLADVQAKSKRELQEAEFDLRAAQAKYDAAISLQATYKSIGTNSSSAKPVIEVPSPIAGMIVHQSDTAAGEYVPGEKTLFTVLDSSLVFLEAKVPEANIASLGAGRNASYEVPTERGKFIEITGEGKGRFIFSGIQIDPATHTVPLIYEVVNANGALRIGQTLNLYVQTKRAESALAIPDAAIVEEENQPIAFVQVAGETFAKRFLVLGIRDGNWIQVLSGLKEGERVVTQGAYALRLASVSSNIPAHGHAH